MCGILGLAYSEFRLRPEAALKSLLKRGPDEQKVLEIESGVVFGHTRLAVIDKRGGTQPMTSMDGRLWIVFNGEIYNHKSLRARLVKTGYLFHTESDTEVLLSAFAEWGSDVTRYLDGIFAFAVWDARSKNLFIARDRFGVKPIFFSSLSGFVFGSTLTVFEALEGFVPRLNPRAIRDYLAFHVCSSPESFYQSVQQLEPGHQLTWSKKTGVSITKYWTAPDFNVARPEFFDIVEQTDHNLRSSVSNQLAADVPLGAFLSGGVDSSLITYYAREHVKSLKTFNVAFAGDRYDETEHAIRVSEYLGTTHTTIQAPSLDASRLRQAISDLDQPLSDPAYIPSHAMSEVTRREVTVALSGDGADELFGGYGRYLKTSSDFKASRYRGLMSLGVQIGILPGSLLRRSLPAAERVFYNQVDVGPWECGRKSLKSVLNPDLWTLFDVGNTHQKWRKLVDEFGGVSQVSALMRSDLHTYLSENCMAKVDRASMAYGLEVRVPFLGNSVVDSVLPIPVDTHFYGGNQKAVLRALAERYLPKETWDRPKHGFTVPTHKLLTSAWRETCEDLVCRTRSIAPFLDGEWVQRSWKRELVGKGYTSLTYSVIVLLLWLDNRRSLSI